MKKDIIYIEISSEEFKSFLSKKGWTETDLQAREIVYQFPLTKTPEVVIKVYSAIPKNNDNPPNRQQMKIFAIDLKHKKPLTKSIHIEKTINWKNDLKEVILTTFNLACQRR